MNPIYLPDMQNESPSLRDEKYILTCHSCGLVTADIGIIE